MTTVILVPRRAHPERDRLWAWCRERWERYFPEFPIYEGHHDDGPFNRSAAINTAARLAGDWDQAIVIDADIFIRRSQVLEAVQRSAKSDLVTWAHKRWRGFHEYHTKRTLNRKTGPIDFGPEVDRDDMDIFVKDTKPLSWSCCVVIPRTVWDDLGGFDERFEGWGFEDMAFKSVVTGLYGWDRVVPGDVFHLFHERSEERIIEGQPATTALREHVVNGRLGRRYMVAAYRDIGVGDEVGEILPAETRKILVRDLTREDVRLTREARHMALPDWSKWWPTLEELRDGAKAYNSEQRSDRVTVVITSGGTAETWPVRREYLRQALASFNERVTGPVVKRVVFSDWPAAIHAEVEEIARPFGFYTVGGAVGEAGDYTAMRQRLWRYLRLRAAGDFLFVSEDDFTFTRDVDLAPMIATLKVEPHLAQLALLRDACYQDEVETGGILGWPIPSFEFRNGFVQHRNFWTANASLFRKSLTDKPWPDGDHSETLFGKSLYTDPAARSGFWGDGLEPWITHIGAVRAGTGY